MSGAGESGAGESGAGGSGAGGSGVGKSGAGDSRRPSLGEIRFGVRQRRSHNMRRY